MSQAPKIIFLGNAAKEIENLSKNNKRKQEEMVSKGVTDAVNLSDQSLKRIDAILNSANPVTAWGNDTAFADFLGTRKLSKSKIENMRKRLQKLNNRIHKRLTIKVRPSSGKKSSFCKGARCAFNASGVFGVRRFNLCPCWFNDSDQKGRAAILIHELVHSIAQASGAFFATPDMKFKGTKVRGEAATKNFAKHRPRRARRNPENIEFFMRNL